LISTFGSKPSVAASFSKSPLRLFSSISVSDMLRSVLSELLESLRDRSGGSSELWSSVISLTFSASAFKASITDACRMWRRACALKSIEGRSAGYGVESYWNLRNKVRYALTNEIWLSPITLGPETILWGTAGRQRLPRIPDNLRALLAEYQNRQRVLEMLRLKSHQRACLTVKHDASQATRLRRSAKSHLR